MQTVGAALRSAAFRRRAVGRPFPLPGVAAARGVVNGQPDAAAASTTPLPLPEAETGMITVHFLDPNVSGPPRRRTVQAAIGRSVVDVAKEYGVDIQAACGQKLQCATCHVIMERPFYDVLNPPGVREGDLLDSTFTLTETSRLGCQVRLTRELDGMELSLPDVSGKGSVRMTMDQPRPQVRGDARPGMVPAVAPRPGASAAKALAGARGPPNGFGLGQSSLQQQLHEQRDLATRLESELRQLRAKNFGAKGTFQARLGDGGSRPGAGTGVGAGEEHFRETLKEGLDVYFQAQDPAAKGKQKEKEQDAEDTESLAKIKAELQSTRVDVSKLGRRVKFEDVIGLDSAKTALREAIVWPAVADPSLFHGVRGNPGGLLLYGPPGCGKTMLARAAAAELTDRAAFFHVRPGDVMSKFYGESQKRVQALEELVQESAPAVVFLDEVDSLLGSRDGSQVAEHHRATTNALLAWMDGFGTGDERVFFLGATNRAEAIDEAALRRFGEAVEVGKPSKEARLGLLQHLAVGRAGADGHAAELSGSDLEAVAERTEGYSLADLDRLVRRAFMQVLRQLPGGVRPGLKPQDVPPVVLGHFESAMAETSGTSALRGMLEKRAGKRDKL